jgi:Putative metal-binding domain of cation transport ATPase
MEQANNFETDQCLHCGCTLEGSPAQRYSSFCSDGCKIVYHNIHDLGLEDYYQHCKARGYQPSRPTIPQAQDFEYFDRRSFQKGVVERHGSVHSATIFLEGTEGPATAWLIEKLPSALSGMFTSSINIATGVARFSYYPDKIKLSQILQTVNELGFVPPLSQQKTTTTRFY